jgi:serine/threonine protein kinase
MIHVDLDNSFVEEVDVFVEYVEPPFGSSEDAPQHHCVSIERPQLTLDKVVNGMLENGGYTTDPHKRNKYSAKVCSVLRLIGKALRHLHTSGVIHGNVCMETCGKFDDSSWKLLDRLEVQVIGATFDHSRFDRSFPPESIELAEESGAVYDSDDAAVSFSKSMIVDPSIDIWSFGQTCYETLVGKPLIESDINKSPSEDAVSMLQIMEWNESNMQEVFTNLLEAGIEESGADLITSCLFARPQDRPSSMDEVLDHPFWTDMRKHRSKKRPSRGSRESSTVGSPTKSLMMDVETYEV